MLVLMILHLLMIGVLLMLMLTRARPWMKAEIPGRVIQTARLSFFQRLRVYSSSLTALALGIILGVVGGWLPSMLALFAGGMALAILFIPMSYTFTTQGVAVGQAMFRPWKEFSGFTKKTHQVVLEHRSFMGRLTLFVRPVELERVLVHIKQSS